MPPILLCVHLAAIFQHKSMEEQHWGEYCRMNCMALSQRMRQRDAMIGALEQTGRREKIVCAVAYIREIHNGDMEKLDWYRAMVTESHHRLGRKQWFVTTMMNH
ncbi:hypothetical protein Tco_1481624 [Tanacetum coccineum]